MYVKFLIIKCFWTPNILRFKNYIAFYKYACYNVPRPRLIKAKSELIKSNLRERK